MNKKISLHPSALRRALSFVLLGAAATAGLAAIASSGAGSDARIREQAASAKIAPWVLDRTAYGKDAEFLVILPDQADLTGADALSTKSEKGRFVRDALWTKAETTQAPLLNWLREHNVEHRSYYIVNMIWVKGSR